MQSPDAMLAHETIPLDVRKAATSLGARAGRITRNLSAASLPPHTRRVIKAELRALIKEARDLMVLV